MAKKGNDKKKHHKNSFQNAEITRHFCKNFVSTQSNIIPNPEH